MCRSKSHRLPLGAFAPLAGVRALLPLMVILSAAACTPRSGPSTPDGSSTPDASAPAVYQGAVELDSLEARAYLLSFAHEPGELLYQNKISTTLVRESVIRSEEDRSFRQAGIDDAAEAVWRLLGELRRAAAGRGLMHVDYYVIGSSGIAAFSNSAQLKLAVKRATGLSMSFLDSPDRGDIYYSFLSAVPRTRYRSGMLVDVGSSNTRLGCMHDGGRFESVEIPYGAVTLGRELMSKSRSDQERRLRDVANRYRGRISRMPCLRNSEQIYFIGGAPWATATFSRPGAARDGYVPMTLKEVNGFLERIRKQQWNRVKASSLENGPLSPGARREIAAAGQAARGEIEQTYQAEELYSGVSLMKMVLGQNRGAQAFFVRNGNPLYAYALQRRGALPDSTPTTAEPVLVASAPSPEPAAEDAASDANASAAEASSGEAEDLPGEEPEVAEASAANEPTPNTALEHSSSSASASSAGSSAGQVLMAAVSASSSSLSASLGTAYSRSASASSSAAASSSSSTVAAVDKPLSVDDLKRRGDAYLYGRGAARNEAAAITAYTKAAEAGSLAAASALGALYETGNSRRAPNACEAEHWYGKALKGGDQAAEASLGALYTYHKRELMQDAEAVRLCRSGAERNVAKAQGCLGTLYMEGRGGLPRDETQALIWLKKAAAQGDAPAQSYLGLMYLRGRVPGISREEAEATAVKLFRQAVAQHNALAAVNLGSMYDRGLGGLTQSEEDAEYWYRDAAQQRDPVAEYSLAVILERKDPGNDAEVVELYKQAACQGYERAVDALKDKGVSQWEDCTCRRNP